MNTHFKFIISIVFIMTFSPLKAGWSIPGTDYCVGFGCSGGPTFENVVGSDIAGGYYQLWGEAGRGFYVAGAETMSRRHSFSDSEWLDQPIQDVLYEYFGSAARITRFNWGAPPLDKLGGGAYNVSQGSKGQAFGHRVYLKQNKPQSYDFETIKLIIHELVHVLQYEKYGESLADFGYHYFKEYAEGGSIYENNDMEREADAFANKIINEVYDKLPDSIKTGLIFCNKTDKKVYLALGYYQKAPEGLYLVTPEEWFSKGWYHIEPNDCSRLRSKMNNKYYYYYAHNNEYKWSGDYKFCTSSKAFDITTRNCDFYGYDSKLFKQLDRGSSGTFKQNITLSDSIMSDKIFDAIENNYGQLFPAGSETQNELNDGVKDYYRYYPSTDSYLYVFKGAFWYKINGGEWNKFDLLYKSFVYFVVEQ